MFKKVLVGIKYLFCEVDIEDSICTVSRKFRNDLVERFGSPSHDILEIGCYRGLSTPTYATCFREYLGIDVSKRSLFLARLRNLKFRNVRFQRLDLYDDDWSGIDFAPTVVIIDALHDYESVSMDIRSCVNRFPEAIIVFDDFGVHAEVRRAIEEASHEGLISVISHIGLEDISRETTEEGGDRSLPEGVVCRVEKRSD